NTWQSTGLSECTSYDFQVKTRDDSSNESTASTAAGDTTDDCTAPTQPTLTVGTVTCTTIDMSASGSTDACDATLDYYFWEVGNEAGNNSGWQAGDSTWQSTGLSECTSYDFQVKTRDDSSNESTASTAAGDTTDDCTAPSPDPMTFATAPASTGTNSIDMTATTASDTCGTVQYYFTCASGSCHDSGWQASTYYEDTGLTCGTTCTYTVKARDDASTPNETAASAGADAQTDPCAFDLVVDQTGQCCDVQVGTPVNQTVTAGGSQSFAIDYGSDVQLTVVAGTFCRFDNWTGSLSGTGNPDTIHMDGDKSVTAQCSDLISILVTLQGDNRPEPDGWEVPLYVGFYPPGSSNEVLLNPGSATYYFSGTATCVGPPVVSGTSARLIVGPVNSGTYDITADSTTTLLNVKRSVYIP
ncbi:MAG: hypothetical protein R6U37_00300, partial [Dehalococcoidia bacterium]